MTVPEKKLPDSNW